MMVDANVLLYAVDPTSAFHTAAKEWLERAFNGPKRVGLPWPSLVAFQRIATHPRAAQKPLSPKEAWSFIADWLQAEQAWIPAPGDQHADILRTLIIDGDLRGNLVSDAHLAALAMEHGVGVCSFDSDFARFTGAGLHWANPAVAG